MVAGKVTPLMKQYNSIKIKYPDAILLFRVGDFYETFSHDAILASKILGIVLTKRSNGSASEMELAGFPYHSLDSYLPKLVKAGYRVAVCDQLEDAKTTKTIVKRGVTELVTPGVTINDKILNHKTNNFLCSVAFSQEVHGISFLDISTGEFLVSEGNIAHIEKLIQSFQPAEIIFSKTYSKNFQEVFGNKHYTFQIDDWIYQYDFCKELMLRHFETVSLKGFGIEDLKQAVIAAGAILQYLKDTEHNEVKHIAAISRIAEDKYVWLDNFTIRNLELLDSPFYDGVPLIKIIDLTLSPMGARLIRRWLLLPLKTEIAIKQRQQVVTYLIADSELREVLVPHLKQIGDLERLIAKVPLGRINPREVLQLKRGLAAIEQIKTICSACNNEAIQTIADQLQPCLVIKNKIEQTLLTEVPMLINKGGIIAAGINEELDELRNISKSSKEYLLKIQNNAAAETGISSLKIGFNNVFGYYLEVTNVHKQKVPDTWIRKQTLSNAERYITEELKILEEKILGAEEKMIAIEQQLFNELVQGILTYVQTIQLNASYIAQLDCLLSMAYTAIQNKYALPTINNDGIIDIKQGRHPVIEKQLPITESYVPNDIYLDRENQQIIIITGPNMAGKSALLRQTALIVLLTQIGSYVPAASANIGLVDKIFTRVGASDNISSGESTFMVEMNETASILNNISNDSLILLDEIGRGTSTYDGISIAWSIAEYLHSHSHYKPKTLFATHYHELTELAETYDRIKNYNVTVKEIDNKVIFLRQLKEGGSQHSFGIHVARMAGMPNSLIKRANEIMLKLEEKSIKEENKKQLKQLPTNSFQLNFFDTSSQTIAELQQFLNGIDTNTITPVEALLKLIEIKQKIKT
jgi:DNA mismatch repair protein MutS